LFAEPVSAISLGLALVFGTSGLPHILMRFFTVKDAASARKSVFYATGFVAYFCLIIPLLGFGAVAILMPDPTFFNVGPAGQFNKITDLIGGPNMASIHLSAALGGPVLMGFMSAVAFATILAVVAGLTLAGASAVGHDIYGQVIARGNGSDLREVWVSKVAAVCIGVIAVVLSYAFENQNVAFMAGLALSVAASCNFPVLAMAIFWRGTTTRGAVAGGVAGLVASFVLVVLSKTVWVTIFHFAAPLFPYENPALFSMPLAFVLIWLVSLADKSKRASIERTAFAAQFVQSETGIVLTEDGNLVEGTA
jgi:cation/acetate symporter